MKVLVVYIYVHQSSDYRYGLRMIISHQSFNLIDINLF